MLVCFYQNLTEIDSTKQVTAILFKDEGGIQDPNSSDPSHLPFGTVENPGLYQMQLETPGVTIEPDRLRFESLAGFLAM